MVKLVTPNKEPNFPIMNKDCRFLWELAKKPSRAGPRKDPELSSPRTVRSARADSHAGCLLVHPSGRGIEGMSSAEKSSSSTAQSGTTINGLSAATSTGIWATALRWERPAKVPWVACKRNPVSFKHPLFMGSIGGRHYPELSVPSAFWPSAARSLSTLYGGRSRFRRCGGRHLIFPAIERRSQRFEPVRGRSEKIFRLGDVLLQIEQFLTVRAAGVRALF